MIKKRPRDFLMRTDISFLIDCSPVQKRSILKVAIELVKADNKIHSKEISILDSLQGTLGLSQEDLDLVHYSTLSSAVSVIRQMDEKTVNAVIDVFNSIMRIDSDIDFEENLLYASVTMACLPESREWAGMIAASGSGIDTIDKQIVFLEKERSEEAHNVLDDKYDNLLISKAFGDVGLILFYLPGVMRELGLKGNISDSGSERFRLLSKSISYLVPSGDLLKVESFKDNMGSFDSEVFFKVVSSKLTLPPDSFPFKSFLMVKVLESTVLDDDNAPTSTVDFFCLDISSDVKHRILSFVSLFGDNTYLLPYEGYYRLLFDHFSSEAKINSEICLDSEFNFTFPSLDGKIIHFESSPQARSFYLLLLRYGPKGLKQDLFNSSIRFLEEVDTSKYTKSGVFDLDAFKSDLLSGKEEWKALISNTIDIYQALSTKDDQRSSFLSYIVSILSHRSSLKTYLNKGFSSIRELSDKELYYVSFDKETNSYHLDISLSMFSIMEDSARPISLSKSRFWSRLR